MAYRFLVFIIVALSLFQSCKGYKYTVSTEDIAIYRPKGDVMFQGIYDKPFRWIEIVKKFNSKGFSVKETPDTIAHKRILTISDCNYDSCFTMSKDGDASYRLVNIGDSICYMETDSADVYRLFAGSITNPMHQVGVFHVGMTTDDIIGRLKTDIRGKHRLIIVNSHQKGSFEKYDNRWLLLPTYTTCIITDDRISKIVMHDSLSDLTNNEQ